MKRAHRLRSSRQFQRLRREGRVYTHPLLRLTVKANRRRHTRCGFIVGKRIGNAVQRNRARRRTREAVRLMWTHISPGYDMVVVVRKVDVTTVPFAQLQHTIRQLLQQAGVWHEPATAAAATAAHTE